MQILFCGLMYDENNVKELKNKIKNNLDLPVAANLFQKNLLYGFKENHFEAINGLNSLPVGTWPMQYADAYFSSCKNVINSIECENTETINIAGLKQFTRFKSAYKFLKNYIQEHPGVVVLTYNFYMPYYSALVKLKKKGLDFHLCTLVTDLPNEYGIVSEKGIRKYVASYIGKKSMRMTSVADSFVLLTEHMRNPLDIGMRPYVLVEGFVQDSKDVQFIYEESENIKTIVYTGSMNRLFGVENLVRAFELLDMENVELHLYGIGDMSDELTVIAHANKKIKYYGSVSREQALVAQKKATLLVNPRGDIEEFTKYSFPSKTMEYLSSGRPVVAFLLEGMPREYGSYIIPFNEYTPQSMAQCIKEALERPKKELIEIGANARRFVVEQKNRKVQTQKILEMLFNCNEL